MSTVPAEQDAVSDAELIESVRSGRIASYGTLYERHVGSAYNLARQLARSATEADDLVSEAFAKVLDTLRAGKGPDSAFRAYLLTALRHTAYDKTRKDRRVDLNEDMTEVNGPARDALTVPFSDTAVAGLERTMAAKAFARLPERWQAVLWHTEIEQQTPAQVAPILGLTANGVSALAYRAREGLRQAYLQVHLAETSAERCRATAEKLGAWTRDGLSKRERAQVETHLDECGHCRALALELADVNGGLRAVVAPIVLGGAVFAYLAAAGATKASAAGAGAAAVGAGAAATAGASSGGGGAAAGAAAAGPRQFLGVAASGAAMAAAVAVGLAAGGGGQQIPAAVQPAAEAPAQPAPEAPAPAPPPAQQPPAPQTPVVPPAPPSPPPPAPEAPPVVPPAPAPAPPPAPQPPPPPAPQPAPAKLFAQGPQSGVTLTPGDTVDLPITVRNDGGAPSESVAATLNLPPGVSVAGPAGGGGTSGGFARAGVPVRAQAGTAATVPCPASEGPTATCSSPAGLEPGQSVVLLFRLTAGEDAQPGTVTGSISAGTSVQVNVNVDVQVSPPEPQDGVEVDADVRPGWPIPWYGSRLKVDVTNTGGSTLPVTVIVNGVARPSATGGFSCEVGTDRTTCTSEEAMEPEETDQLQFRRGGLPQDDFPDVADLPEFPGFGDDRPRQVTVTATLGQARASATAFWPFWPFPDWPELPEVPDLPEIPDLPGVTSIPSLPSTPDTPSGTSETPSEPASEPAGEPGEEQSTGLDPEESDPGESSPGESGPELPDGVPPSPASPAVTGGPKRF
ncbi:RNA polymerase subunit sigma [Amycolatopsis antarctica]|uniref:RNA polymerase subunit sigma n=1 Tax=Amycolatopsis antarctica TaxID=1854586 RepID=A0A263DC52_9PSEU|nr:sigma-70 family RNA polymerase sigma factor [Amycolatopsis antarctica]OZM75076.1 RNA polymerase subunit sigma [Amycolatopsis antarctica]